MFLFNEAVLVRAVTDLRERLENPEVDKKEKMLEWMRKKHE